MKAGWRGTAANGRDRADLDPALILKVGRYPLHSGGVGAIRSLGRFGVPVYATTEDRLTPAAVSRYCAGQFRWKTTGHEDPGDLVAGLVDMGRRIGRPAVREGLSQLAESTIADRLA